MGSYAFYRLPHEHHYTKLVQHEGQPTKLMSPQELAGHRGFVFAPFAPTAEEPILVLHPDEVERVEVAASAMQVCEKLSVCGAGERQRYAADFARFHKMLEDGEFRKIVLARSTEVERPAGVSDEELFLRACSIYPRLMVVLVHTDLSGTWLMATPEILLDGQAGHWTTMALAGTMQLQTNQMGFDNPPEIVDAEDIRWSQKNIQEQRYVANFIENCLANKGAAYVENGPYTVRAANLVHLRSEFAFMISESDKLCSFLSCLHPTPAVCGMPKEACRQFIVESESDPRSYYSGFVGPFDATGEIHLYVSLRCMRVKETTCRLYAGGGLLCDSVESREWEEIEAKMATMRNILW